METVSNIGRILFFVVVTVTAIIKLWRKNNAFVLGMLLIGFVSITIVTYQNYQHLRTERFFNSEEEGIFYLKGEIPFSELSSQEIVSRSNKIMDDIYREIIDIKDMFPELKDFNEKNYRIGYEITDRRLCRGYCPPWQLAEIRYGSPKFIRDKGIGIWVGFSEHFFDWEEWQIKPDIQSYPLSLM